MALALSGLAAYGGNLLVGDPGVETERKYMTNGTWSVRFQFENKILSWDEKNAYEGKRSIRFERKGESSIYESARLPKGEYVFSFYAKADRDNVKASINCTEFARHTWRTRLGKRKFITLTRNWKQYSYVFKADGVNYWVPSYGVETKGAKANFDAFRLEKGSKASPWKQPEVNLGLMCVTPQQCNIFHPGEKIIYRAAVRQKDLKKKYILNVTSTDWNNKKVFSVQIPVKADPKGYFAKDISIPSSVKGFFRIDAKLMEGKETAASDFETVAVVCKPVKIAPGLEPFAGAAGSSSKISCYDAMKRMGVGWLEWAMAWVYVENRRGQFDYKWLIDYDMMKTMKEKGFFNKVLYSFSGPDWAYDPQEVKEAAAMNVRKHCLPLSMKALPRWKEFVEDSQKKYGKYMDMVEISGELDAQLGINPYFKKKYPQHIVKNYVYGPAVDRFAAFYNAGADIVQKYNPKARLSSMRPSDVDARHNYDFTENVLRKTGKKSNWLGLDCYPQPRWVGPGQPPTGHAALLLGKNVARGREVMRARAKGDSVFVSEYGYFIDYWARNEFKYQKEQANRLATSFIVARANGAKSFFWFTIFTYTNSMEAGRYLMGISSREQPFMGIPAYSAATELLTNVVKTKTLKLSDDLEIYVFGKADGSATAAVWSVNPEFTPLANVAHKELRATDMMGVTLDVSKGWKLSENPVYFWRSVKGEDNFSKLCSVMEKISIHETMPVYVDIRHSRKDEMRVIVSNKSRTRHQKGILTAGKKQYKLSVRAELFQEIRIPMKGAQETLTFAFDGYKPYTMVYKKPPFFTIPKVKSVKDISSMRSIARSTRDHIEPVDHIPWTGKEDLSFDMKLGHDSANLYVVCRVKDDAHYNKFNGSRIWKGDCMQLAIDPLNDAAAKNLFNPDDYILTFALASGKSQFVVHEGPNKLSLKKYGRVSISRDEKTKETLYEITLPLLYIDRVMLKKKHVFAMNVNFFDDDSNGGADYWMFLTRGLAAGRNCALYRLFELE